MSKTNQKDAPAPKAIEDTGNTPTPEYGPYFVLDVGANGKLKMSERAQGRFAKFANDRTCATIENRINVTKNGSIISECRLATPGFNPDGSQYSHNPLDSGSNIVVFKGGKAISPVEVKETIVKAFNLGPGDAFVINNPLTVRARQSINAIPDKACAELLGNAYTE